MRPLIPLAVLAMLLALGGPAAAQGEARLRERLDPAAYAEVTSIVSGARAAGLPERPLVQKALEGASKGAGGPQVVEAVRRLRDRLAIAREALGPDVGERELVSAASALFAGATPRMLQSVRRLPEDDQELSGAFTALAFLLHRGVPPAASLEVIGSLVRSRAGEEDYLSLQQLVEADVYRGASPVDAARSRARALVGSRPGGP